MAVSDLCREQGISSATFYKWRAKFGGMNVSIMARMKETEEVRPSQRREIACRAVAEKGATIALACATFVISESYYRYQPKLQPVNVHIADWLVHITDNNRNWVFCLSFPYLRNAKGCG